MSMCTACFAASMLAKPVSTIPCTSGCFCFSAWKN